MTMDEFLRAAHEYSVKGGVDPAADAGVTRADLVAARARLALVEKRSHIARTQIAAIDRALKRLGDAP